jgi:hypothetical protein
VKFIKISTYQAEIEPAIFIIQETSSTQETSRRAYFQNVGTFSFEIEHFDWIRGQMFIGRMSYTTANHRLRSGTQSIGRQFTEPAGRVYPYRLRLMTCSHVYP